MKQLVFSLLWVCLGLWTTAQSGKITGTISDAGGAPLEFVNVILRSASDSVIAKVAVSNESGKFEVEPALSGRYFLQFDLIGYTIQELPPFDWNEGSREDVGTIVLSSKPAETEAVEVVYRKPLIEVKADKTVFNVENTLNATGLNALELLRKAPGVLVDNNDNISVKGRNGVIVYIDGKLTPLNGSSLASLLKSIQSSNIESIEIISNPSAKYDAAGTAGIINIKLKKNKNFGTNGSVQVGYGIMMFAKYNGSFTINRRTEKWNLFATYGGDIGKHWNWMDLDRYQAGQRFDQRTETVSEAKNQNLKAGVDYYIRKKHTVGAMVTGFFADNTWVNTSATDISPIGSTSLERVLTAGNTTDSHQDNVNANINYKYSDTTGTEFTFDLDHGVYAIRSGSFQPNVYSFPGQDVAPLNINYRNLTPVDIAISSIKGDYEQTIWKGKLGAGFKSSHVETNNTLSFYEVLTNGEVLDSTRSNTFDYTETIHAAYINYSKKWGRISAQGGLRIEQTISRGTLQSLIRLSNENSRDVTRNYTNLFPSGGITYSVNDTNQFSLTYSRRIQRPSYQDLNPFEFKLDELTYQRGNPFLQPQYANVVEFTHTYMFFLNTTLTYSHTEDYFTQVTDTTDVEASYIINRNLGAQDWVGINISAPIPLKKWWNVFFNANTGYLYNRARFDDGRTIDVGVWSYSAFMQHTFVLKKAWTLEASGWYSGPSIWGGTFVNRPMGSMDVAVKKDLWDGEASLRVALGDVLYTNRWRSRSEFGGIVMSGRGGWESRQLRINFTWNFGNRQMKVKERKSGAEDLRERVK